MWGNNSMSQRCQSNNTKLIFDNNKNSSINNSSYNFNNPSEFNLLYQTPIKQFGNVPVNTNNNSNITPFRFDFNHYFGNLWSSGKIPTNQLNQPQIFLSPSQLNKESIPFYKKSIEKSCGLTPLSQIKDSNSNNSNISNSNSNNKKVIIINKNKENELYGINNSNCENIADNNNTNINDFTKKNLNELFNNAKNDKFLYEENGRKINNINYTPNHKFYHTKHKNYTLQISRQFIYSSPCVYNNNKPKKIFECSGSSTSATNSTNRTNNKNKRFRKNNDQIVILKKFYDEHKHWSKNQIKEISQRIGLKENKVYKWLWDQRNKDLKATKFVVNKKENE